MHAEQQCDYSNAEVVQAAATFARPSRTAGLLQVATSFGPFIASCAAMYLVFPISYFLTLALALPTGLLVLRIFIVQHDCGHGSFFASRRLNAVIGRLCSLVTMTPFANWRRQHGLHHAAWGNLDRQAGGVDIYSGCMTVREYLARTRWRRLLYRLPRHPLIANFLLPPFVFVLLYRLPFDTPSAWPRERRSVHLTNLALIAMFATLVALLGWQHVLLVHLPIMAVASILGVWLFTLQHRFKSAEWLNEDQWSHFAASLAASSWLRLPKALHWLTGNIGFHHIHHLNPRIPNYRLSAAHATIQEMRPVRGISLLDGLVAPRLTLWDEASGSLVRFREVHAGAGRRT